MNRKTLKTIFVVAVLFGAALYSVNWASAQGGEPPQSNILPDGNIVQQRVIGSPPTRPFELQSTASNLYELDAQADVELAVPYSEWSFGCSATSAAMIAGYHDNNGFPNMYAGPYNGGDYPMYASSAWGTWMDGAGDTIALNPLSATQKGLDGRAAEGSVDDYWEYYNAGGVGYLDPWHQANRTEHTYADATGDFMYTNQWEHDYQNVDGSTSFWQYTTSGAQLTCDDLLTDGAADPKYLVDGALGLSNFYASRGYEIEDCYTQMTDNHFAEGFSFDDFKAEIDLRYPVMIHLYDAANDGGHTIVGTGYNDSVSPPVIYIRDTWTETTETMNWGANYGDYVMDAVSIVHPIPDAPDNDLFSNPTEITTTGTINLDARGATTSSGTDPAIESCNLAPGEATVWYKYTHDGSDSALSFDTKTSNYDTFIAVWILNGDTLELVACNDDINYANGEIQSQVAFRVNDTVTYYIEIGKWAGAYSPTVASLKTAP